MRSVKRSPKTDDCGNEIGTVATGAGLIAVFF